MRWVIGDIHGMLRPLATLIDAICDADDSPQFHFVGDYVNRGPDSRGVIELLLSLPSAKFCRGNHDDIFNQVINNEHYADNATHGDRIAAFRWFLKYGLDRTLMSYDIGADEMLRVARDATPEALDNLVETVPPAHRAFIRNLEPVIEFDDQFITHGNWGCDDTTEEPRPSKRLAEDRSKRHRLLWGRFTTSEVLQRKAWGRRGYFGHTPVSNYTSEHGGEPCFPIVGPKIVLIDTSAALHINGRLTAFNADTQQCLQVTHKGNLLPLQETSQC